MKSAKRVGILITLTFCIASMMIMAGYQPAHSQANSTPIVTQSSRLAFVSRRDGNAQIYTVYPDGTNPLNVSKNKFNDIDPAWSPDGQHLAFASDRDGNNELCVMDADGSNQNCLTNNATTNKKPDKKLPEDRSPVWSPDNQRIAFISTRNGSAQIYAVNADGSNPLDLTNNPFNNSEPAWSPDLKQVAFVSSRDGNPEICVMDASGFNQRCLTNNRTPDKKPNPAKPQDISPAWSSDSQKLAFVSNRDRNKNPQIYVMNVDGSNPTNITKKLSADEQPAWSPDGAQIAFVSNREGARDIYVMNPDGSGQRRLLRTPRNEDVQPAYAPGAPSAISPTPSQTLTDTPTGTIQFTLLPTDTATDTPTATNIGVVFVSSASPTASSTRLPFATNAPPPAPTNVPAVTNTSIPPTLTFTPSSTPITPTLTFTPSKTLTPTFTPSSTPTATLTPIPCTIVQNLSDGAAPGPVGSLRAAISCAKPGDIITFNPSLNGTISLNSGELVIAKNLTINGLGAAIIKIDAKLASRVFNVQAGTVVISGLTITQGKDTTGKGGAITNAGSLTLNNVFITNSIETVFTGGGIDSNGPSLTLNSVTIDNNQAPSGAGIASINPLVITNSMITNNIVPAGGGVGGGLASYGTLTITGSTFMNNTAFGGGAMYLSASVKNISGTTIQNNTDKSTSLGGGAILTDANAQITLTNSTVSGNTTVAGSGGAFYVTAGSGSCSSLTVNSTVVSNNTAPSNSGGALYVTGGCSATIANGSQFKSNSAGGHGGAVSVNNGSVLIDTNSVLSNNSGDHGGAIDITAGSVTIDGASTISNNNSSSVGGGVYLPAAGNLTVKGKSIISGNVCNNTGGGISSAGSVLITGASQITGNSCDGGGGISSTGSLTVNGYSVISGNTAAFGGGGIDNGGTLIIDQSTIAGNKASTNGAGIRNFSGTLTMTASTVSGNQAFRSGGGVYNYTATAKITNSTISGNQAGTGGYSGGGIQDGDAGSTYINTNLTLLNDTIYNNSSSSPGANLYSNNINATMSTQSTIFADANGNGFADPDIAGYVSSQGYNLIQNPTGVSGFVGTDITNQDPNLYPLGNYRGSPLQTNPPRGGSPVIDVVPVTGANCPPTDEIQLARPVGSQCDIGAVEYNGLPPTPPPPPSSAPVLRPISATPSRTNTPTLTVTPTSTRTNTPIAPTASLTVTPIPRPATKIRTNTPIATSTAAHTPLLPTAVITATPFAPTGTLTITPTPISTLVGGEPS